MMLKDDDQVEVDFWSPEVEAAKKMMEEALETLEAIRNGAMIQTADNDRLFRLIAIIVKGCDIKLRVKKVNVV